MIASGVPARTRSMRTIAPERIISFNPTKSCSSWMITGYHRYNASSPVDDDCGHGLDCCFGLLPDERDVEDSHRPQRGNDGRIGNHQYDDKVTGTNDEAAFFATHGIVVPKGDDWHSCTLTSFTFKIGGETIPVPLTDPINRTLRFASTHFGHAAPIDFTLIAVFHLSRPSTMPTDKDVTVTVNPRLIAWNVFAGFGTTVGGPAGANQAAVDALFSSVSNAFCTEVSTEHATLNHSIYSASISANKTPDVQNDYVNATSFAALTHGTPSGFYDSFSRDNPSDYSTFLGDCLNWMALRAAQPQPYFNVVGFWACDTLSSGSTAPTGFGISSGSVDQAFVGFDAPVIILCGPGPDIANITAGLDQNASKFYTALATGQTVADALGTANFHYQPWTLDASGMPVRTYLGCYGDLLTRLRKVYLTQQELDNGADATKWYYLLP